MKSLTGIGVPKEDSPDGRALLNMQMGGMLLGGILWGILGDKRGRLSVLFGSIILYSVANIANGFVDSVAAYAVAPPDRRHRARGRARRGHHARQRGDAKESRGYGTTIVAAVGITGAVVAALVGDFFDWRTAYIVGGIMGIALLVLRIGVFESGMFEQVKASSVSRGSFFKLFSSRALAAKYLA